jgi:hypothetical protein
MSGSLWSVTMMIFAFGSAARMSLVAWSPSTDWRKEQDRGRIRVQQLEGSAAPHQRQVTRIVREQALTTHDWTDRVARPEVDVLIEKLNEICKAPGWGQVESSFDERRLISEDRVAIDANAQRSRPSRPDQVRLSCAAAGVRLRARGNDCAGGAADSRAMSHRR